MHRPKTERQALAQRLLGTASEPGPIDVGWLKRRLGVTGGSYIKRWRANGIPEERLQDLELALAELLGHKESAPPPEWARRLAIRVRATNYRLDVTEEDLARAEAEQIAEEAVGADELGQRPPGSGVGSGGATA